MRSRKPVGAASFAMGSVCSRGQCSSNRSTTLEDEEGKWRLAVEREVLQLLSVFSTIRLITLQKRLPGLLYIYL